MRQPVTMGGSGSGFIYGFVDANYRSDMDKEECVELARNGKCSNVMFGIRYIVVRGDCSVTLYC